MSSEGINKKKSFGSNVLSIAAFPVGMSAAGGVKNVIRYKGVKNAISALNKDGFKALKGSLGGDCFSRGLTLASNYDEYNKLAKEAAKLAKRVDKGKIPLFDRFKNIFRRNKVTLDTIKERSSLATENLNKAKTALKNGEQIAAATGEAVKTGFGKNVGSLIKKGFKDKMVWVFTAIEAIPEITGKIIPTFKEKGVVEGLKQVGKSAISVGSGMVSYVAGSAFGRVLGTAIGTIFCPGAGSAVGGNIGSMIGISLANILKGKIFKHNSDGKEAIKKAVAEKLPKGKTFTA